MLLMWACGYEHSENQTIEVLREWSQRQKQEVYPFKEVRMRLKDQIKKLQKVERSLQRELERQCIIMEEAVKLIRQQKQRVRRSTTKSRRILRKLVT